MADLNAINGANPLAALQGANPGAGKTIRVTPMAANAAYGIPTGPRQADTISFSKAAEQVRQAQGAPGAQAARPVEATYGGSGLQATTPAAARQALAQSVSPAAREMVAARVERPMDYLSGQAPAGNGMPFYTNPAMANGVATSTSAARLGGSIDTSA
ncbi:MAG: hypothetical protein RIB58_08855 [Phycisphaerales bacterium]